MSEKKSDPLFADPHPSVHLSFGRRVRTYFLTGLVVAGPLAITAYLTWSFVTWVDGLVKPFLYPVHSPQSLLPFEVPGLGLIVALVGLTLLGFLTANLIGRSLLVFSESILSRMPVIRGLYKGMKQIFTTVFNEEAASFRKVGMVQYPAPGMWTLVFLSSPPSGAVAQALEQPDDYISCFLPCTPNPTTGFYFYVKRHEVVDVAISVEDAAKLIMSAGMIQPDQAVKGVKASPPKNTGQEGPA